MNTFGISTLVGKRKSISRTSFCVIIVLILTFQFFLSPSKAEENLDQSKLMVSTWNIAKARGDSDLSAAQAVVGALLILGSESEYGSFKNRTSPKAKKIVTIWLKSKKAKLSDAAAAKKSGFTSTTAKSGDIYFLKKGVSAWQNAKKASKSDSQASDDFTRAVWEATLSYAAILMTSDSTVQKIKQEIESLNTGNSG